jgi:mitochondrial fusion and transport protein UGO1
MDSNSAPYAPFGRTATSRDAPNPLRPYYIPPSIGLPPDPASPAANGTSLPSHPYSSRPGAGASSSSPKHDFRELFSDIDYGDYIGDKSEGAGELAKRIVDQAIWNYASVFLAQPFEVAKVVLQCHETGVLAGGTGPVQTPGSQSQKRWQNGYEDVRYPDVRFLHQEWI